MTLTNLTIGGGAGGGLVGVPDVQGLPQADAEAKLRDFDLVPKVQTIEAEGTEGTVFGQNPAANTARPKNTVVTLLIIKAPVVPPNLGQLLQDLGTAVGDVGTSVDQIVPAVEAVGAQVTTVDGKLDSTGTKLDGLIATVGGLDTKADALGTTVAEIDAKLDDLGTTVAGMDTKVEGLGTKIDGVEAKLDGVVTKVDALATAVAAAETDTAAETRLQKILDAVGQGQKSGGSKPSTSTGRSGARG